MPPAVTLALQALLATMALFSKLKEEAKRTGELTPQQEAELDIQVNERMKEAHWTIQL